MCVVTLHRCKAVGLRRQQRAKEHTKDDRDFQAVLTSRMKWCGLNHISGVLIQGRMQGIEPAVVASAGLRETSLNREFLFVCTPQVGQCSLRRFVKKYRESFQTSA